MISVVLPVYNREAYLADAIRSVLNQTYKNFELIIVDDGSTDSSFRIYDFYKNQDKRVKVIKQSNKGISVARQTGVEAAQGEFIAVMDSDDIMAPNRLEKSLKAIKGVDFVYSTYYIGNENAEINSMMMPPKNVTLEDVKSNGAYPHVTIMGKKEVFNYRPDFRVNDDAWLVWNLFKNYKGKMIKDPLVIVRMHEGSISKTHAKEIAKTQRIMDEEYSRSGF